MSTSDIVHCHPVQLTYCEAIVFVYKNCENVRPTTTSRKKRENGEKKTTKE